MVPPIPMRSTLLVIFSISFVCLNKAHGEQIYYFEDDDGVVHFSDEPDLGAKTSKTYEPSPNPSITIENSTSSYLDKAKWRQNHSKFKETIHQLANTYNVAPALVEALILAESAYNPMAISRAGARGLMQLMPKTAKSFGVKKIHDPEDNISGGIQYLSLLIDKYNNNLDLALAAYNAGETAVEKYKGIPPYAETIDYVAKVRKYYSHFAKQQHYIALSEPDSI